MYCENSHKRMCFLKSKTDKSFLLLSSKSKNIIKFFILFVCGKNLEEKLINKFCSKSSLKVISVFINCVESEAVIFAGLNYESRRQVEEEGLAASLVEEVLASSPELANTSAADNPPEL
jgi:hypothetical protein